VLKLAPTQNQTHNYHIVCTFPTSLIPVFQINRPDSLEFGHGSHACPGRFFAVNVLKAIVAHLLLKYDLKLRDGDTANAQPKYNRILVLMPDIERVVEFRRRGRKEGGGEKEKEEEEGDNLRWDARPKEALAQEEGK
jgi:hypothetical protein